MPPATLRARIPGLIVLGVALTAASGTVNQSIDPELTAHEWGTFASIAGKDGKAIEWSPLNGSTDLPSFVEHFRTAETKVNLRGTVRMETPVLYFYSPRETTLSVHVAFSRGVITEWYPHASRLAPNPQAVLGDAALFQRNAKGSVTWDSVTVAPGLAANFPREARTNPYYAARETAATPLLVKTSTGNQQEKFLFYRGVSTFSVPVSATVTSEGKLLARNLTQNEVPSVILFERHGDKLGYRLGGALQTEKWLDAPELTSSMEALSRDLADVLISQGLHPDEARAMIETWRQSWFEEGSRLFYIVPTHFLNEILPLTIHPAPSQTTRVFVGRLELMTPATKKAVEAALATHDKRTLTKYGRFLQPILDQIKAENPGRAQQLDEDLTLTYSGESPTPTEK